MEHNTWKIKSSSIAIFTFMLFGMVMWQGCSKEEFGILDVPFDELQSSYYVLGENTIEIPSEKYTELIVARDTNSLVLSQDEILNNLKVGSIIITAPDVLPENLILRKVTSITEGEDVLEVSTVSARVVEALSEYYIDSEFSSFVRGRSDEDLSSVDMSDMNSMFSNVAKSDDIFKFSPVYSFDGKPSFTAIHPHTAYKYFGPCNGDKDCFDNISKVDSDFNSFYDVVDDFFNNSLNQDLNKNGLFTIAIKDFGLKSVGVKYGTSKGTGGPVDIDPQDTPEVTLQKISSSKKKGETEKEGALNLKYFLTPATVWVFTVTIPAAPIVEFDADVAMSAQFDVTFPNRANVTLGHLNWNSSVPSLDQDFSIKDNGVAVGLGHFFENPSASFYMGIEGKATVKFGAGIGVAISSGEPNTNGISIGGMFEFANYYTLEGNLGFKVVDILNNGPLDDTNFFGEICFDSGFTYDISLFTDSNFSFIIGDFFDAKVTLPKALIGLKDFSMMQFIEPYATDKGVCVGFNLACDGITQQFFSIGFEEGIATLLFRYNDPIGLGANYEVELDLNESGLGTTITETTKIKVLGDYSFNEQHSPTINKKLDELKLAIQENRLKVKVTPKDIGCDQTFDIVDPSISFNCQGTDFSSMFKRVSEGTYILFPDIFDNAVYYYDSLTCVNLCSQQGGPTLPTSLEIRLNSIDCMNPSGIILQKENDFLKFNSEKLYARIPVQPNMHDAVEVTLKLEGGKNKVESIKTVSLSKSTLAPCACNLN